MSGSHLKRPLDSPEDRPGKKTPSAMASTSTVNPYNIVGKVTGASVEQILGAASGLSVARYGKDVCYIWDKTEYSNATVQEMHESWFRCRRDGLIDQLWTLRVTTGPNLRCSEKRHIFRTIVTLENLFAEKQEQVEIADTLAVLLVDYLMMMVLLCTESNVIAEAEQHFPNCEERFAELTQRLAGAKSAGRMAQIMQVPFAPQPAYPPSDPAPVQSAYPLPPPPPVSAPISDSTRVLIESMRVTPQPGTHEIVGCESAKKIIAKAAKRSHLASNPNRYRGLLLHGVPGTGKTTMALSVASTSGQSTVYMVRTSSLMNQYVGNSEKSIAALFTIAQEHKPAIIFFDGIESLFASGERAETSESGKRIAAELLVSMSQSYVGVTVIGATNLPWLIGSRLLRRFDVKYHVALPSANEVVQILETKLRSLSYHVLNQDNIAELGAMMDNFTGDDIERVIRIAWNLSEDRLDDNPPSYYRPVQFLDRMINVACLPGENGAIVLSGDGAVKLEPGPTSLEEIKTAIEQVRPFTRQWIAEEARHTAWSQEPTVEVGASSGQVPEDRSLLR